jgi:hypothetical protein
MATNLTRYRIGPQDRALIAAFRDKPIGPHAPALQRLLNRMRGEDIEGKHVLISLTPHREWEVAELQGRGKPPKRLGIRVSSVKDGEWQIFKLRWLRHTGERLDD